MPKLINILLLGIVVFLVAFMILLIIKNNNKVDNDLVNELYSYLGSNDLSYCEGLYAYGEGKIESKDVADQIKLCSAYLTIQDKVGEKTLKAQSKSNICKYQKKKFATDNYEGDTCTLKKFAPSDIAPVLSQMYNVELQDYPDFNVDDNLICRYIDKKYYCGLAETIVYSTMEEPKTYRVIKKTVQKDDYFYIYDLYLKIHDGKCYLNNTTAKSDAKCTEKYQKKQDVDVKLLKKYGQRYKHTFKLNTKTNKYYWVKSEVIE